MTFHLFKHAVASQFAKISKEDLYCTEVDKDTLYKTYLESFPAGTNPIFRERSEHDCSCCRQFIRAVGNVVTIGANGKIITIWDGVVNDPTYTVVAKAMSDLVKSRAIDNRFFHYEKTAGTDKNFEEILGKVKTWEHFHVNIPDQHVKKPADLGPFTSELRSAHDVLLRGMKELDEDAIETVYDLCRQNSIYRGQERLSDITKYRALKKEFLTLKTDVERDIFAWKKLEDVTRAVSGIRNSAIGTLLIDLSEGTDLEGAVRKFETSIMAPSNYKRPTALVSKAQVEKARKAIEELGLLSALERRYAHMGDIKMPDIIFADRTARKTIEGDVFDSIATKVSTKELNRDKVDNISIDDFIANVLPGAQSLEVMVENRHLGNLVSLVAPVDPTAKSLFKWDNGFSWSYNGDVADSIKERVKQAGGSVLGDLCCRLAWSNFDDLDLHMKEPGGYEIYYGNRAHRSPCGGMLDVDMNAGSGHTRTPVENIFYATRRNMKEGIYELIVNQYSQRETKDVGFEVEIDYLGQTHTFSYPTAVRDRSNVTVAKFKYSHQGGIEFMQGGLDSRSASKKIWNVDTQEFHKVSVVMNSPNHWDDGRGIGNKHIFFMLEDCKNDGQARGFYNEFLKPDLDKHRKVIEMVGAKMKTDESVNQLSGIGFSTTQPNEVLVKVKGSFTRTLNVLF